MQLNVRYRLDFVVPADAGIQAGADPDGTRRIPHPRG
ncbi:MAG: hypothetical protein JWP15_839 [Alphaproteobacteria bacterium]|nr:hypothetical protein [Alphaproteobacteria bacterium]